MGIRTLRVDSDLVGCVVPLLPRSCKIVGRIDRDPLVLFAVESHLFSDETGLDIEMIVKEEGLSLRVDIVEKPRLATE